MKFLVDTHLLIWAATDPDKLSATAKSYIAEESNQLFFSSTSIWETSIKAGLGKSNFTLHPSLFCKSLLKNHYIEIKVSSLYTLGVYGLPQIHRDPFDLLMIATVRWENMTLLTNDSRLSSYGSYTITALHSTFPSTSFRIDGFWVMFYSIKF